MTSPKLVHSVDPQYSEEARQKRINGSVEVYLIIDDTGAPRHVRVVRGKGYGLDEKAVEAVWQYRFKPAMKNGVPVASALYIDVSFQIR